VIGPPGPPGPDVCQGSYYAPLGLCVGTVCPEGQQIDYNTCNF
jgi:hypothetical protein